MVRHCIRGLCVAAVAALTFTAVACSSPAAPAPTAAPAAKPATTAPTAAPTAAPTKAPEATKPAAPSQPTAAPAAAAPAKPADWPKKSIQLIIPWDAGGSTDVGFRLLAPLMEKTVGATIELINKPGAGSQVGVAELARAKPDGYTIGNVSAPAVITIYQDPERKATFTWSDFAPIGLHVFDPGTLAVPVDSKYKSMKDLIDDAKANPEKVKVATTGILGDDHLAILALERLTGAKFSVVHFTGGAPQVTALLGGHVDVGFDNIGTYAKLDREGKTRILAVLDTQRNKFAPNAPTAEEQGFKVYSSSSRGLAAPKGTPKEIVWAISQAMEQAMKDPDLNKKMDDAALTQRYMNPDQFDKYWKDFEETAKPLVEIAKKEQK